MTDTDTYILDCIRVWVWSGFYDAERVDEMIDDVLEDDADEDLLRAAVAPEFARKAAAEAQWPATTDCDRLDQAFAALDAGGIIALQNAGYSMSDGLDEVSEVLAQRGRRGVVGYCFYHGQDLERALDGQGLSIAFGALADETALKTAVGERICALLRHHGFSVEWDGDPERRIALPRFDWKRRFDG